MEAVGLLAVGTVGQLANYKYRYKDYNNITTMEQWYTRCVPGTSTVHVIRRCNDGINLFILFNSFGPPHHLICVHVSVFSFFCNFFCLLISYPSLFTLHHSATSSFISTFVELPRNRLGKN